MIQAPTLAAGETKEFYDLGDFFRLMKSTDPITVRFYYQGREVVVAENIERGYAERFRVGQFDRFTVYSATAQTISFAARLGNEVSYDVPPTGAVTVSGGVALDAATLAALEVIGLDAATLAALESVELNPATLATLRQPLQPNAFWTDDTNVVGNSSKTIFTDAANVNGAIVFKADITSYSAGSRREVFIKKSGGLPGSVTDGGIVLAGKTLAIPSDVLIAGDLQTAQFIEPGFSLSYISSGSITANSYSMRSCVYRLL